MALPTALYQTHPDTHSLDAMDRVEPAENSSHGLQNSASADTPPTFSLDVQQPSSSSSDLESRSHTPSLQDSYHMRSSISSMGADAEGSPEQSSHSEEFPVTENEGSQSSRPSTSHSTVPSKRKHDPDIEKFILQDPALYGLRRSGRAHGGRRVIESSSEGENSDYESQPVRKRRNVSDSRPASVKGQSLPPDYHSSSESDTYGGARARAMAKKQRRRLLQTGSSLAPPPTYAEVRFSTRRSAKVATYNETGSDDEDLMEEDTDSAATGFNYAVDDDDSPAVDVVIKQRRLAVAPQDSFKLHNYEFHIKWQRKAYIHSTWEVWSTLSSLRGSKRVVNYFNKHIDYEKYMLLDPSVTLEEREQDNLKNEEELQEYTNFTQVERVIDHRITEEGFNEYLIKWKGLFYDSCTWEESSLISKLAQNEIDRFLDRSARLPASNKLQSNPVTRTPYKPFKEQPSYIKNGDLREFQIIGVNFLAHSWCKNDGVILADEMGLGKTVQTVAFLSWLIHEREQQGPFLIVVPLSTVSAWAECFDNWSPDTNYVLYQGNATARATIRDRELFVDNDPRRVKFNVLITTYEFITMKDGWTPDLQQVKWQFMAVDEAHRLKNRESLLYGRLMELNAPNRLLITGTPVQNNLAELSALLNFANPGMPPIEDNIDLQSADAEEKINEVNRTIAPYILRRTKAKVENDLPPKSEKTIRVEMADVQLEYYKNVLTRNYTALNATAGNGQKQSLLNIVMELRKASNHPFMFANAEERVLAGSIRKEDVLKALITSSGKMMLLDRLLTKLKEDGHRVLIFSQMVRMLNILGDYLHARGHQFQRLDGTISASARKTAMDHFNAPESNDFCFLLSTRAGGLGINLMTADTVILFDSDWNPQADLQAMARAHRIGQKKPVTVYRFVSANSIEENMIARARNKRLLEYITIQKGLSDKEALAEAEKTLQPGKTLDLAEPERSDDIGRLLKQQGQKVFEIGSSNQQKLEALDIDAVLAGAEEHKTQELESLAADGGEDFLRCFDYTDVKVDVEWDDILPKAELAEIKAEEKRKEEERFLKAVIEENAPRKRKAPNDDTDHRVAKKRARAATAQAVADSSDEEDSSSSQQANPSRPLNEKEVRNLIRAYERYGSIEDRGEDLVKEAKLERRDRDLLKSTLQELRDISQRKLEEASLELEARERAENKIITKKERKAVLFEYRGVKRLNAEILIQRPVEMRMLKAVVDATPDIRNFRVAGATKAASYTSSWGAREDGMLCVGIARHGYGAWVAIRDDPDLGLQDRFYLDEHQVAQIQERKNAANKEEQSVRSPGAVHLVRRANYLLDVLKVQTDEAADAAARRALENHHRNNKKTLSRLDRSNAASESPGPSSSRKPKSGPGHVRHSSGADHHRSGSRNSSAPRRSAERQTSEAGEAERRGIHKPTFKLKPHKLPRTEHSVSEAKRPGAISQQPTNGVRPSSPLANGASSSKSLSPPSQNHDTRPTASLNSKAPTQPFWPSMQSSKNNIRTEKRSVLKSRPSILASNGTDLKSSNPGLAPTAEEKEEMKLVLRPVRPAIDHMRAVHGEKGSPEKVQAIKDVLTTVAKLLAKIERTGDREDFEMRVWAFFTKNYWSKPDTDPSKLKEYASKLLLGSGTSKSPETKAPQERASTKITKAVESSSQTGHVSAIQKEPSRAEITQQGAEGESSKSDKSTHMKEEPAT